MSGAVTVTGSGDHLEKRLIRANLILVLTPYLIKYPQMNKNAGQFSPEDNVQHGGLQCQMNQQHERDQSSADLQSGHGEGTTRWLQWVNEISEDQNVQE